MSLIAQTPYGAMSLKEYGWETYRVRSHSIPPSLSNTDSYHSADRRISKGGTSSSPRKSISLQVTPPPPPPTAATVLTNSSIKPELNEPVSTEMVPSDRSNPHQDPSTTEIKSRRSLTMPSTILLNSNEKTDVRHGK